jgi:aryl-alcohol dehydrogenase-like predicted oxidoreductase
MRRREFLKTSAAGIAAAAAAAKGAHAAGGEAAAGKPAEGKTLPRRDLGKTGEKLSIIGLGGIVVCKMDQEAATKIVRGAIERGVSYFDVAPSYFDGEAEERLGRALEGIRDKVFLACKTTRRDRQGATEELERSLKRLRTDRFDLYQLHALTKKDEDVEKALGPGGALEAFVEAKKQGKVRFLGFSAHSVEAALLAMERFAFDTVLFPFNWVCWSKGNFGPQVIEAARKKGMGCLALKAMARTPWPQGAKREEHPKCWYQPSSDEEEASLALRFTLSKEITAAIPPGDVRLFELALKVAGDFRPLTEDETKKLLARGESLQPIFRHG